MDVLMEYAWAYWHYGVDVTWDTPDAEQKAIQECIHAKSVEKGG